MRMWIGGMILGLVLPACSAQPEPMPTQHFVNWSRAPAAQAKRLCVLPFDETGEGRGLAERVRQAVAGQLSLKRFADTELHAIDDRLAAMADWRTRTPQSVGRLLECDALVYGRVAPLERLYLVLYTQLALEGTLQLVDAATGRTLVHEVYTTRFHDGGLPLDPVSLATTAARSLGTYSEVRLSRAIDDLGRNLAALVPDLPDAAG